jgi:hypothetical protein
MRADGGKSAISEADRISCLNACVEQFCKSKTALMS